MKKLLVVSLMLAGFTLPGLSQTSTVTVPQFKIDTVTKKIIYTDRVNQPGLKDTLYNRAIHWCGKYFKNAQSVLKTMDKPNGKVVGTHSFKVFNPPISEKDTTKTQGGVVKYTFTIELKDDKYRYKITDLNLASISYFPLERWLDKKDPSYIPQWDYYLVQVDQKMKELEKSIKKGMLEAVKIKDDW